MSGYGNYDYNKFNETPAWVSIDRYDYCEMPLKKSGRNLFGMMLHRVLTALI